MKTGILLGVLALVVAGVFLARSLFPSEQKQVRERYESLSRWVSMDAEENIIETARRLRDLPLMFAESCIVKAHPDHLSGTYTPDELAGVAVRARSRFRRLSLRFYDIDIRFPAGGFATVMLTGRLRGMLKTGGMVDEMHAVESELKKVGREWRFTRIEVVEVLEK